MEILSTEVAIASGMVAVQAGCTPTEAIVLMQERADVSNRTLDETASAVVDQMIRFGE